jgi:hypothetical protein
MAPEQELDLHCHLAAGTDLPTAIAALPQSNAKPVTRRDPWQQAGLLAGTVAAIVYWIWASA